MSRSDNIQLQFYIRLTEIIGRTCADLKELLTEELRRLQSNDNGHSERQNDVSLGAIGDLIQANQQIGVLNKQQNGGGIVKEPKKSNEKVSKPVNERQQINRKKKKIFKAKTSIVPTDKKHTRLKQLKRQHKLKKSLSDKYQSKKHVSKGRPYPPLNAFMLFLKQNKRDIMLKRPQLTPSEVSIYASTIWNQYGEQQKEKYLEVYRKNHEEYQQELKRYQEKEERRRLRAQESRARHHSEKDKEGKDSPFSIEQPKLKDMSMVPPRQNLRSRSHKNKSSSSQIICIDSEAQHSFSAEHSNQNQKKQQAAVQKSPQQQN